MLQTGKIRALLVLGMFALAGACFVYQAWAFRTLWAWFVVPTLGLPSLALVEAAGLMIVIDLLTYHSGSGRDEKTSTAFVRAVVAPTVFLVAGWILHFTM